eukprot:6207432-Pleurochrysis_carterae.AAC.2
MHDAPSRPSRARRGLGGQNGGPPPRVLSLLFCARRHSRQGQSLALDVGSDFTPPESAIIAPKWTFSTIYMSSSFVVSAILYTHERISYPNVSDS